MQIFIIEIKMQNLERSLIQTEMYLTLYEVILSFEIDTL